MFRTRLLSSVALAASLLELTHTPARADPVLAFIPTTGNSYATGISGDGTVVVGTQYAAGPAEGFIYSGGVLVGVGFLDPARPNSQARAVSGDGLTVVGSSVSTASANPFEPEAFRWNGGVITGLGYLDQTNAHHYSEALAVSGDGSVIVGDSINADGVYEAFRWQGGTMSGLGYLSNSVTSDSYANGVSDDGLTVVGSSINDSAHREAFRWNGGVMTGLGFLDQTNATQYSIAYAISADSSVIVGFSLDQSQNFEAFRWNGGVMTGLGFLDQGDKSSMAVAASRDGSVVVGQSGNLNPLAFRWSQQTGMQSVADWLGPSVDLAGFSLISATGVSSDGSIVVGAAADLQNMRHQQAYIARVGALLTQGALTESFAAAGSLSQNVGSALTSLTDDTDCTVFGPNGICAFADVTGLWSTGGDASPSGSLGMAVRLGDKGRLGVDVGYVRQTFDMAFGGSASAKAPTFGVFAGYGDTRQAGLRFDGAMTYGNFDVSFDRGYQNGAGEATSRGDTNIKAFAAHAGIGYGFQADRNIVAGPFADIGWSRASEAVYEETTGPFPASFKKRKDRSLVSKLGATGAIALTETLELEGSAALAHRLSESVGVVSGDISGMMGASVEPASRAKDWGEVSADLSWHVTPQSKIYARATGEFGRDISTVAALSAGLQTGF